MSKGLMGDEKKNEGIEVRRPQGSLSRVFVMATRV